MIFTCCPFFSGLRKTSGIKRYFSRKWNNCGMSVSLSYQTWVPQHSAFSVDWKLQNRHLVFDFQTQSSFSAWNRNTKKAGNGAIVWTLLKSPKNPPKGSHLKSGLGLLPPNLLLPSPSGRRGTDRPVFVITIPGHQQSGPGPGNQSVSVSGKDWLPMSRWNVDRFVVQSWLLWGELF